MAFVFTTALFAPFLVLHSIQGYRAWRRGEELEPAPKDVNGWGGMGQDMQYYWRWTAAAAVLLIGASVVILVVRA